MADIRDIVRREYHHPNATLSSDSAVLYYDSCYGTRDDPRFVLSTSDGMIAEFGRTALAKSVKQLKDGDLETLLQRDEQGRFHVRPGIDGKNLMDLAYSRIQAMDLDKDEDTSLFKDLNGKVVMSRFDDFNSMKGIRDIIPDYSDHMVFIKASEGCANRCRHCPEAGYIDLYTRKQIDDNMRSMRKIQERYHGEHARRMMYEGFVNASDILWFEKLKSDIKPVEIIDNMFETFPELCRVGAFMEVQNILEVSRTGEPGRPYSADYLKELAAHGLTRAYVGIETAHHEASRILGKVETYEDKLNAIELLKEAGIAVKAIILLGRFGQGFYGPEETYYPVEESLEMTSRLMAETKPYRIMLSRYLDLEGLPDYSLGGRIVGQPDMDREEAYLRQRIIDQHHIGARGYQGVRNIAERMQADPPFEPGYEDFVTDLIRIAA